MPFWMFPHPPTCRIRWKCLIGRAYTYRLGAPTCLAGDRLGDYSFAEPLAVGDELVFDDMAHYTMVKTTFFNGVRHPDIAVQRKDGSVETVRRFSYEDFEARLG